jgi:hypothetical protein
MEVVFPPEPFTFETSQMSDKKRNTSISHRMTIGTTSYLDGNDGK